MTAPVLADTPAVGILVPESPDYAVACHIFSVICPFMQFIGQ